MASLGAAFAAGALLAAAPTQAAFGFCSQPTAPSAFLVKPNEPYCAISQNCSEWDVQNYRNEIDRYFDSLKRYARDVDQYYNDASSYISCMADLS